MKSQPNAPNAKARMYTMNEDIDMKAKVAAMARRLEELEMKKIREVQAISETLVQAMSSPPQASSLEQVIVNLSKVVGDFVGDQKSINAHSVKELTMLTNLNTVQEKGKFPSQPHQNPKGIHEVEAQEGESSQVREVKAMITLRSGKEVDLPTSKPEHEPRVKQRKRRRRKSKEREKGTVQRRRTLNLRE
ncbi:hypothetical protein AAG906_036880 [Vitis piasezkii]